jgi:hypothetical protein
MVVTLTHEPEAGPRSFHHIQVGAAEVSGAGPGPLELTMERAGPSGVAGMRPLFPCVLLRLCASRPVRREASDPECRSSNLGARFERFREHNRGMDDS